MDDLVPRNGGADVRRRNGKWRGIITKVKAHTLHTGDRRVRKRTVSSGIRETLGILSVIKSGTGRLRARMPERGVHARVFGTFRNVRLSVRRITRFTGRV